MDRHVSGLGPLRWNSFYSMGRARRTARFLLLGDYSAFGVTGWEYLDRGTNEPHKAKSESLERSTFGQYPDRKHRHLVHPRKPQWGGLDPAAILSGHWHWIALLRACRWKPIRPWRLPGRGHGGKPLGRRRHRSGSVEARLIQCLRSKRVEIERRNRRRGCGPGVGLEHLVQGQWKSWVTSGFDSSDLSVTALLMDRQGALWIGTSARGIYRIYQDKVEHFRSADGLSSDAVYKLYEDREGNVWAATSKGIDRFRDLHVASYSAEEGVCTSEVDSILAGHDGTLWIGGDKALGALRQDHPSCVATGKSLPGNQVTSLFEDHEHRLWIGIDNSLMIYEKGGFTPINRRDGTRLGLVAGIAEDEDHNIWVVTAGRHRELIRIADRIVQEELEVPQIPAPHKVAADPQGGMWLGLMNGDLARYRHGRMDVFHFERAVDSPVVQLSVSSDGTVLGATASGLIGWKDGKRQSLTGRNGLPCDAVNAFITDDTETLWLYMRCGLAAIAKTELQKWWEQPEATLKLRVFDALDGVQPGLAPFQGRSVVVRQWQRVAND
jgi:hypothetical protein